MTQKKEESLSLQRLKAQLRRRNRKVMTNDRISRLKGTKRTK